MAINQKFFKNDRDGEGHAIDSIACRCCNQYHTYMTMINDVFLCKSCLLNFVSQLDDYILHTEEYHYGDE